MADDEGPLPTPDPTANVTFLREVRRENTSKCPHRRFEIDTLNHRVECADCGSIIEAYQALMTLAQEEHVQHIMHQRRWEEARKLEAYQPRLRNVRTLEEIWRARMLPTCPHCHCGVEAADLAHGSRVSREYNDTHLIPRHKRLAGAERTEDEDGK